MALTWLENTTDKNVQVVNGTSALYLEVCKLSQYAALQKAGLQTPATRAVVGRDEIPAAATAFNHWPVILKPNRGGKGLGVLKFDTVEELTSYIRSDDYAEPLDGIWLLQAYIQPAEPFITRCEFVGQSFVYAVQVDTTGGFELCPADVCAIDDAACPVGSEAAAPAKFRISTRYQDHPVLEKLQTFMRQAGVDVAGIEVIEDAAGELYVYDVNTNTNYNAEAEQAGQVERTGMGAVADYLISLARTS